MSNQVKQCAGAILLQDTKILLGKRSSHKKFYPNVWDTIGGHCKSNEVPEQTLVRELKEEIGIIPVKYKKIAILDEPEPKIHGYYKYHIYLVTSWNGSPGNLSQEHSELKWFTIEEAKKLRLAHPRYPILFENIQTALKKMKLMWDFELPEELKVSFAEKVDIGEKTTNDVYFCKGEFRDHPVDFYLKVNENPPSGLTNEKNILEALTSTSIPAPRVLWFGEGEEEILALEAIKGYLLWDYIDPKRKRYDNRKVLPYLNTYGRSLAELHNLTLNWAPQKRPKLYHFIGEQDLNDERFASLVSWLRNNEPSQKTMVFVHGDYNTASVIFDHDEISGIIDWEFAGSGWKEYDLAWILRARLDFLNTDAERQAILDGYKQLSTYDDETLRWCEILNYLHFAYWDRNNYPLYTKFAIQKAREII